MPENSEFSSVQIVRRQSTRMPSILRNIFRALIVLVLIPLALFAAFKLSGNEKDAIATGEVSIDPVPLPPASDTLGGTTEALPDLLDGEVPDNVNPTEILDALGNPVASQTPSDLAGGTNGQSPETMIPQPAPSGPKTILIDGKPLGTSSLYNGPPLVQAPIAGLTRPNPFGLMPTIGPDGKKPVAAYAKPFTPSPPLNTVSLVIGGMGIDQTLTRRIINETPPEVTLSFAAHATGLQNWINLARANGHEVMIELPMESETFNAGDPSTTHTLRVTDDPARNIRSLDWLMSRAQGYFAVTNYNGDVILKRSDAMGPVLAHISNSGIGFVFDGSLQAPTLKSLAESADVPYAAARTLLDIDTSDAAIRSELADLRAAARAGLSPIGVGFAYPQTLEAVKGWVATLEADGLELAPVSYMLDR